MKKLLLSIALVACAKTDSDSILTRGMHASFTARASNGSTVVSATLFQGQPFELVFVELTGDDQLIAHHGGQERVMAERELLNVVSHDATFPTDAEGAEFEVEFRRSVDDGAPSSTVTLPAKFTLSTPPSSASRAAGLNIAWSPAGSPDRMGWRVEGDCIEIASGRVEDTGVAFIPANTIKQRMPAQGQTVPESCSVRLELTRSRERSVDPAYGEGGTFTGVQAQSATFTTTP